MDRTLYTITLGGMGIELETKELKNVEETAKTYTHSEGRYRSRILKSDMDVPARTWRAGEIRTFNKERIPEHAQALVGLARQKVEQAEDTLNRAVELHKKAMADAKALAKEYGGGE